LATLRPIFQKRKLGLGEFKSHDIVITLMVLRTASFDVVSTRSQVYCSKYFPIFMH